MKPASEKTIESLMFIIREIHKTTKFSGEVEDLVHFIHPLDTTLHDGIRDLVDTKVPLMMQGSVTVTL
jgi:hypothetical protein